ncbi:MAG: metallophosphoesterase [Phycisphaerales bacterium]|nr:MAG: metallophosphoesterase [Phycisphaerales bacterium]
MPGKLISVVVLMFVAAGNVSASPHPYLTWVHEPSTSIVVNWWNPAAAGDSTVEYGQTASYGSTVHDPAVSNFHHVELTGLTPGTRYHYRISSSDGTVGNDTTFTTSAPYPTSLMFAAFGDSQGTSGNSTPYHQRHKAQCDHMATKNPDFVLHLGDKVNEGSVENDWVEFFNAEQNLSKSTVIMPILGNHEVQPNGQPYYYYWDLYPEGAAVPNNGVLGKGPRTYSFDYGNTHHVIVSSYQVNKTQERDWIKADLAAAVQDPNIEWIFAHMHKPLYTSGPPSFIDTEGQNLWAPLFEQYGVDIVFGAHWHFYERSYPLKEGRIVSPEEGVVYITSALAGGPFNCQESGSPHIPLFETYYCNQTAAVYITIDGAMLTGQLVTVDDEVVDTFAINKYDLEASDPSPADGTEDVALDAVLGWSPGFGAASHDVYFGPNSPPAFLGSTIQTRFDPGPLEWRTTYYWRIDEVEADGTTIHTGDTWSFKTVAREATRPDPADHAVGVALDKTLSWTPGVTAASHDVYFGAGSQPLFIRNQEQSSFDPGPLELSAIYSWRIDEIEADGTTKYAGDIWSFKTSRPGTGTILREVWEGVAGTQVSDLTGNKNYPGNPSYSDELSTFETPTSVADDFGCRIQGWLHPETSGDYTFWIACDQAGQLWLSTDQNPGDASMIAHVTSPVGVREFDDAGVVPSGPIHLEADRPYYIMALYKEGIGRDNLAVAWQGPDSPTRSVIHGYFLTPFVPFWASNPNPRDGAPAAPTVPNLRWNPGITAASHEVYFSSDEQAVRDGTVQAKTPTDPTYRPGILARGQTYYWRVDEIEADGTTKYPGAVWSFTVTTLGR